MEPSSGQQRLLFVVVVLVLAGLGVYLISARTHNGTAATPTASVSATGSPPATSPAPPAQSPALQPPTTPASAAASVPGGSGRADIYQWLPFSQQDLTEAARTTVT